MNLNSMAMVSPPVVQATQPCCAVDNHTVASFMPVPPTTYPVLPSLPNGYQSSAAQYGTTLTDQPMPSPTTMVMPTLESAAQVLIPPVVQTLTPQSLSRPLPSIVATGAVDVSAPQCDGISQWVNENKAAAIIGLVALGFLMFNEKGRRG